MVCSYGLVIAASNYHGRAMDPSVTSQSAEQSGASQKPAVTAAQPNVQVKQPKQTAGVIEGESTADLIKRMEMMEAELYMARQLQQSLLPETIPGLPAFNPNLSFQISRTHVQQAAVDGKPALAIHGCYIPCDALGGDFYDIIQHDDGSISLLLADVSGHGVTAGFVTAIIKALFHQVGRKQISPAALMSGLNNHLAKILKTGAYATGVAIHLTPNADGTCTLKYSNAGHPYPYLWHRSQDGAEALELERLNANGMALAWFADMDYPEAEVTLKPGHRLVIYTDGTPEMMDAEANIYTEEAFEATQHQHIGHNQPPTLDYILQDLSDFACGTPLNDDLTMVMIALD